MYVVLGGMNTHGRDANGFCQHTGDGGPELGRIGPQGMAALPTLVSTG
jgi:hypothetical protein